MISEVVNQEGIHQYALFLLGLLTAYTVEYTSENLDVENTLMLICLLLVSR